MSAGGPPLPWPTVTLDRDAIVRSDFPAARRGLDPEAVRAHLEAVADEVEALRTALASATAAARAASPSAASAASERVATIVAAAEQSAAEIERSAREDAERVRAAAAGESRELVEEVRAASAELRVRIAALDEGLASLDGAGGRGRARGGRCAGGGRAGADRAGARCARTRGAGARRGRARRAGAHGCDRASRPAGAPAANGTTGDVEGARLVALNMALSGASREEADRYVAEHFDVPDRAALLDDVFATVELPERRRQSQAVLRAGRDEPALRHRGARHLLDLAERHDPLPAARR